MIGVVFALVAAAGFCAGVGFELLRGVARSRVERRSCLTEDRVGVLNAYLPGR